MSERYADGEHVTSYCTQCELQLVHTIRAKGGRKATEVTCNTCGSTYPFKRPSDAPKSRVSRVKKGGKTSLPIGALWEARIAAATGEERVYTMVATYRIGDVVLHEQFGKGVVLHLATHKCRVLFQDQERLMASANE